MELNSNQIQEILPHRYPFLLVDRILECEPGKMAKGIKCVSARSVLCELSIFSSVQLSSVVQSCPTLCNLMDCSTPGLPAHHQLPEFI